MNHLILVLGCHRSGTSLVASSLPCLGAKLGPDADWSAPDNPAGFHEHRAFLNFNVALLNEIGRTWDDLRPYEPALHLFRRLNTVAPRMLQTATEGFARELAANAPIFGLKEPRLTRLMPFWRPIFEAAGCAVSVVHAVRHPAAVARSLYRRDRITIERGMRVWEAYNKGVHECISPSWASVVVDYDRMLAQPLSEIGRMAAAFGLAIDAPEAKRFARYVVDETLRHEDIDGIDLPPDIAVRWEQLSKEAEA